MANQVKSITDTYSWVYSARDNNHELLEIKVGAYLYTNDAIEVFYSSKEHSDEYTLDYLEIGNTRVPLTDVDGKGVKFKGFLPTLNVSGKVDIIVHDKLIGASSTPITPTTPKAEITSLNLTNCFTNYKVHDYINAGSTIIFTPMSGYEFTENGTVIVYNYGMSHNESISKDTGTYKIPDDCDQISFAMNATKKVVSTPETPTPETPTPTPETPKAKITALHLTNCVSSINGVTINLHDKIDVGSTITVKANPNFKFTSNGSSSLTNTDGVSYNKPIVINTNDNTLATIVIEDDVTTVDIEMNAIEDVTVPDVGGGFINTYVVDNNILNELSKNRFTYKDSGSGGASSVTIIDNATMITSLLHIPYSVKSITGSDNDIILGNHNTKVQAPRLTDNVLHVDFGTIKVEELNKDNSDYQNTDCELYVPYSTPIKLDSENIINKSIHIMYVIDVYSGSGKIVLSDDNSIVGTYNIDVGSEIPFVQSSNNSHVSNLKMSVSNMITRPYIRIKYYDRLDTTYNSNRLALVSDMKGFIQVNNILKIDSDEIDSQSFDEIKNELNSGIII